MLKVSHDGHELLSDTHSMSYLTFGVRGTFQLISKQDDHKIDDGWLYGSLVKRYASRARDISVGRNRIVFIMNHYVVKIPRNADGERDNDWEGSVQNMPNSDPERDIQYPRTRLAYWRGVPIVFMEKVEEILSVPLTELLNFKEPEWVASVDCGQVGFTKDCRIVAFDYGF